MVPSLFFSSAADVIHGALCLDLGSRSYFFSPTIQKRFSKKNVPEAATPGEPGPSQGQKRWVCRARNWTCTETEGVCTQHTRTCRYVLTLQDQRKAWLFACCFPSVSRMWLPHDQNHRAWLKPNAKLWKKSHLCLCTNKGQLISKHQKSPISRLRSRHWNIIKPDAILYFAFLFLRKKKTPRSISELSADDLFKKKTKKKQPALFSLVSEFEKRSTNLVSMEPRDCTVRKGSNEKTARTTSLSPTVNYLGIRYRLPTRRNSTQQTEERARGGGDGGGRGGWGGCQDMTRGGVK